MGHKIVSWDLDSFALHDVFQSPVHQIVIKSICRDGTKGKTLQASLCWGWETTSSAWGAGGHSWVLQFPAASGTSGLGPTPTVHICRLLSHTEVRPGFPDQPAMGGRWVRHLLLFLGNNHQPRLLRPSSRWEPAIGWDLAVAGKGRLALSSHLLTPFAPEQNRQGPLIYLLLALLDSQGLCPRAGPYTAARWGYLSMTKILA